MDYQPPFVTFLWNTKIRSRNSFLTILEFMNLQRIEFKALITMIKTDVMGSFYDRYLRYSY